MQCRIGQNHLQRGDILEGEEWRHGVLSAITLPPLCPGQLNFISRKSEAMMPIFLCPKEWTRWGSGSGNM